MGRISGGRYGCHYADADGNVLQSRFVQMIWVRNGPGAEQFIDGKHSGLAGVCTVDGEDASYEDQT